jgi:RNA polymerase sigma-70 factor (ECF subfamily)
VRSLQECGKEGKEESALASPDLIRAACAGDEAAFAALYKAGYKITVRRLSLLKYQDPEDLAQMAWLRAWEQRERYRFTGSFLGWVTTIGKNLGRDRMRRVSIFARLVDQYRAFIEDWTHSSREGRPFSRIDGKDDLLRLQAAMDQLSDKHREIIQLRELCEYSYDEIAKELNCPRGTVMSRLNSARKNLIHYIQQQNL